MASSLKKHLIMEEDRIQERRKKACEKPSTPESREALRAFIDSPHHSIPSELAEEELDRVIGYILYGNNTKF